MPQGAEIDAAAFKPPEGLQAKVDLRAGVEVRPQAQEVRQRPGIALPGCDVTVTPQRLDHIDSGRLGREHGGDVTRRGGGIVIGGVVSQRYAYADGLTRIEEPVA